MRPDSARATPAEEKFDQAREEVFGNEGAPPPAGAGAVAANADSWGDEDGRTMAASLASRSDDDPASPRRPTDGTGHDMPSPDMPAADAAWERTGKVAAVARVCSLLSVRLPSRSC
jgi:hypothetical protein